MEEQKRKQDEAARKAAEGEQPVVKPLPETGVSGEVALSDPASMLKDPASPLSKRSIYYDFDAYNIKEEFQPVVEAHAKFLLEHKEFKMRVEGNCDERGSREYNLALGQRRADSREARDDAARRARASRSRPSASARRSRRRWVTTRRPGRRTGAATSSTSASTRRSRVRPVAAKRAARAGCRGRLRCASPNHGHIPSPEQLAPLRAASVVAAAQLGALAATSRLRRAGPDRSRMGATPASSS